MVLANTGTPGKPTPRAVRKYLSQFLMDRRIRPMGLVPWSLILHLCILPKRGKASAQKYRSIWTPEGSPLVATQEKLARGLEAHFAAQGTPVTVRSAMSYGQPSLEAAIKQLKKAGAARIVVLPLYPQAAFSTTGSVTDKAERAFRKSHFKGETVVVSDYHNHPVYLKAMAAAIRNAGYNPASDDRLLFSFHSVPLNDREAGDNYELGVHRVPQLRHRLPGNHLRHPAAVRARIHGPQTRLGAVRRGARPRRGTACLRAGSNR